MRMGAEESLNYSSEFELYSAPGAYRSPGRKKSRVANREISAGCGWKGPRKKISGIVIRRGTKLRRSVVAVVEQVVDLDEELNPLLHLIMRSDIHHSITGREALSQVIDSIGLVQ